MAEQYVEQLATAREKSKWPIVAELADELAKPYERGRLRAMEVGSSRSRPPSMRLTRAIKDERCIAEKG